MSVSRRQFLRGATTAAVVAAVPIVAVGQQERFLVKNLGLPKSARRVEQVVLHQTGAPYAWEPMRNQQMAWLVKHMVLAVPA